MEVWNRAEAEKMKETRLGMWRCSVNERMSGIYLGGRIHRTRCRTAGLGLSGEWGAGSDGL